MKRIFQMPIYWISWCFVFLLNPAWAMQGNGQNEYIGEAGEKDSYNHPESWKIQVVSYQFPVSSDIKENCLPDLQIFVYWRKHSPCGQKNL